MLVYRPLRYHARLKLHFNTPVQARFQADAPECGLPRYKVTVIGFDKK